MARELEVFDQARVHLGQGLELAETAGDTRAAARSHSGLAQTWASQRDNQKAVAHLTNAIQLGRTLGAPRDIAMTLSTLGRLQAQLGQYEDARAYCEAALTHNREPSQRGPWFATDPTWSAWEGRERSSPEVAGSSSGRGEDPVTCLPANGTVRFEMSTSVGLAETARRELAAQVGLRSKSECLSVQGSGRERSR